MMEELDVSYIQTKTSASEVKLKNIITLLSALVCILFINFVVIGITFVAFFGTTHWNKKTLLVVSFDGFRADYITRYQNVTGNFQKLKESGVDVDYLIPTFPTFTFTNHYTISTGLYPESHGIISNHMFDPQMNVTFSPSHPESLRSHWWHGEPIWLTAMAQNKMTASVYWPGSEVRGKHFNYYEKFNASEPNSFRLNKIYSYLELAWDQRPELIMAYFQRVDDQGHAFGPDSQEVYEEVKDANDVLGSLMAYISRKNLDSYLDLVILSDHGMANAKYQVLLDTLITDYKNRVRVFEWIDGPGSSTVVNIQAFSSGDLSNIMTDLAKSPWINCYLQKDIPETFRLKTSNRVGDILCVAISEAYITTRDFGKKSKGTHGYVETDPDMRSMFIGYGPTFIEGMDVEPFSNIHLYNMFCHIIQIVPKPNNGSFDVVSQFLH